MSGSSIRFTSLEEEQSATQKSTCSPFKLLRKKLQAKNPERELCQVDVRMAEHFIRTGQLSNLRKMMSPFSREQRSELFRHEDLATSLHLVLQTSTPHMVSYLITKCGVHVDEPNEDGLTPLFHATRLGLAPMVRVLLRHGADICAADSGTKSCRYGPLLHEAVRSNDCDVVDMILKAGADPSVTDAAGERCLEAVAEARIALRIRAFVNKATKNQLQISGIRGVNRQDRLIGEAAEMSRRPAMKEKPIEIFCVEDRIEALELCGVMHWRKGETVKAMHAWEAAMHLRWKSPQRLILKTEPENSFARIIGMHEPQSLSELALLSTTSDIMDLQSLLVLERVLPIGSHVVNFACYCVRASLQRGNPTLAVSILRHAIARLKSNPQTDLKYAFDTIIQVYRSSHAMLEESVRFKTYFSALDAFTKCLQATTELGDFRMRPDTEESYHDMAMVANGSPCTLCRRVRILEHYCLATMTMLLDDVDLATPKEFAQLEKQIDAFIEPTPWLQGETIFHRLSVLMMKHQYHSSLVEKLLLSSVRLSRSLPQAHSPRHLVPNSQGSTPLHLMVAHLPKWMLANGDLVDNFLAHGAHLCTRDHSGQSVRSILLEREVKKRSFSSSLACLSASVVARQARWRELLPEGLNSVVEHFIQMHL